MESSHTVQPAALPPGSLVGSWRLLGLAAEGSYGIVFRAERADAPGAGEFALKLARLPADPRFALEVELLSRVRHPNVPRLHDSGEWAGPEGPHPFLVMDQIFGTPVVAWHDARNDAANRAVDFFVARSFTCGQSFEAS